MVRPSSGLIQSAGLPGDRVAAEPAAGTSAYSRHVARAKFVLPIAASALLLLVAIWPYLSSGWLGAGLDKITASQIRDLRMVNPRFSGIDKEDRPFVVAADAARQTSPDLAADDALVSLERPRAHMLTREGTGVDAKGVTGVYQPETHFLDLRGNVTLTDERGYHFASSTARVNLQEGTAEGHDPVSGFGPAGTVEAQGFETKQRGGIVVFTGKSTLHLNAARGHEK